MNQSDTPADTAQQDENIWTDFETEEGSCGSQSADGNAVWGAYCPQPDCGELNLYEGDPSKFANRPYRCCECNWISLMHESVTEIKEVL